MQLSPGRSLVLAAALLLSAVSISATHSQTPSQPQPPRAETRDRYLNPRETDISLNLEVDPSEVPEVPPVEPDKVLETFRIKSGFRIELVAHEPHVIDPVQIAFDEDGRLFVIEMRWYQSEMRSDLMFDERIGRIRLLEDTDGDGRFEKSTIFADKLRYPSAVVPYDGGVYVGLEPDILYMKDTTGDGVADVRRVVFTGFGNHRDRLDSQMFLNSLTWGLDNRIHGAKGHGGTVSAVAAADQAPVDLRTRDFSFDPRSHRMRPESGGGKQGLSFDDYGRKFVCTQSVPFMMLMYEDRYAARNPHFTPPRPLVDIGLEPDEHVDRQRVHRISPEDPWRRVRNRWRAEGIFAGPPPQPAGYITAATGVTVYRGDAFPAEYRHSVFVGASANNLVHHRRLEPDGVGFRTKRVERDEEFLASSDIWFRPVALANGPDGALYVADLYREIIDFSDGIPESIKRFKDLNRGNDRGRIYRIVPDGFGRRPPPQLSRTATADLVRLLEHPNAWHRESAARLIYTRQDKSVIPALAQLAEHAEAPLGRLHALYALDGLDALAEPYVVRALDDPVPGVREHGVRLTEKVVATHGLSETLWHALERRQADPEPRVRYQLAFTLGELQHPRRTGILFDLLEKDLDDPWVHIAVLTSLAHDPGEMFNRFVAARLGDSPPGHAFLRELLRVLGHRNRGRELLAVLNHLEASKDRRGAFSLLAAFANGLQQADVPLALFQPRLQPILDHAVTAMRDSRAPDAVRVEAIELLGLAAPSASSSGMLLALLDSVQPRAVHTAAIVALGRLNDPSLGQELLRRWSRFTPALKRQVMPLLLTRPERVMDLMDAVVKGLVPRNELTPTQIAALRAHRTSEVRRVAASVFQQPARGDRPAAIQRYVAALQLQGNGDRGRVTYHNRCAACHEPDAAGQPLGPSTNSMRSATKEELLTHLIDPNRTVDARYRAYAIETADGATVTGIVHGDTAASVTIQQPFRPLATLMRTSIARMQGLEQSLMPEGLEEGLSVQDVADLLEFIVNGGRR